MSDPRKERVLAYKDMLTMRRMMVALSSDLKDMNRAKGYMANRAIEEVKGRLTSLRSNQRDRSEDTLQSPRSFAKRTETSIKEKLRKLLEKRKFRETIVVGGAQTGKATYKAPQYGSRAADVTLCVGYMWLRNVWENIYKDKRMVQDDYIILSAVEYRTNVPHIRLYEASTYGITEKKQVNGWIGQSKLGGQLCLFRTDKTAAIQAAQKLTLKSVNTQLQGETTNG